jgi:uncharacterized protein (UPF0297 family)
MLKKSCMYDCERDFMDNTKIYDSDEIQTEYVAQIVKEVSTILESRGYNPVNQIVGFLMSGDPGYISSYKEARSKIQGIDRAKIVEILLQDFQKNK